MLLLATETLMIFSVAPHDRTFAVGQYTMAILALLLAAPSYAVAAPESPSTYIVRAKCIQIDGTPKSVRGGQIYSQTCKINDVVLGTDNVIDGMHFVVNGFQYSDDFNHAKSWDDPSHSFYPRLTVSDVFYAAIRYDGDTAHAINGVIIGPCHAFPADVFQHVSWPIANPSDNKLQLYDINMDIGIEDMEQVAAFTSRHRIDLSSLGIGKLHENTCHSNRLVRLLVLSELARRPDHNHESVIQNLLDCDKSAGSSEFVYDKHLLSKNPDWASSNSRSRLIERWYSNIASPSELVQINDYLFGDLKNSDVQPSTVAKYLHLSLAVSQSYAGYHGDYQKNALLRRAFSRYCGLLDRPQYRDEVADMLITELVRRTEAEGTIAPNTPRSETDTARLELLKLLRNNVEKLSPDQKQFLQNIDY